MDLSLLNTKDASEEGTWMPVLDLDWTTPFGDAQVLVLGPDSSEAARLVDEEERLTQRHLAEAFANKQTKVAEDGKEDRDIRKACRITKNWKEIDWEGKPFPYSPDNAKMLYTKVPHLRAQVLMHYNQRSNFTSPEYASWRKRFGEDSSSTGPEKAGSPSEKRSKK